MATFSGVWTAIVTPFKDGKLDKDAFKRLIDFQVEGGVAGIVPCGTTGESVTLSREERLEVIKLAVEYAAGRIGVVAGTANNNTAESVAFTKDASALGIQGCLLAAPAYNKPTQEGLFQHHVAIAQATDLPIMLYNVPGRAAVNIQPETIARIFDACSNVVAVKEACGDIVQISNVKRLAPGIDVTSGDDGMTLPVLAVGGTGVVSVLSNAVPKQVCAIVELWNKGELEQARMAHEALLPFFDLMFAESNPIPVKYAVSKLGYGASSVRLPLIECSETLRVKIDAEMKNLGVL